MATQEEPEHVASSSPLWAAAYAEIHARAESVRTLSNGSGPAIKPIAKHMLKTAKTGRIAIVDGVRTPFAKAGTHYAQMDVVDLASVPAAALVSRMNLDPDEIDQAVFGVVVPALYAPNLGREVILRAALPRQIEGTTVNLACASSARAITHGAEAILAGQASVVLAGGAESLSNVPITYSQNASKRFMDASRAKSVAGKVGALSKIRPGDLVPVAPAIAEHTTGMTMGQASEKMAKENAISRRAQDEIALLSHQRAALATDAGRFDNQLVPVFPEPRYNTAVVRDNGIRADTSLEQLSRLRPVFDPRDGTLTAGNSSPLTDGASAVVVMSEKKAKALGYRPLGYIRAYAYHAVDPSTQLLQGPAYAAPMALDRAGLTLADIDLIDMHEAFAAQVLSNLKAFASKAFAEKELGRTKAVGEVDFTRLNVNGGSIAIGHPFGATGGRVTIQVLRELERRGENLGLVTVCTAGGNGFAMVVERA